MTTPISYKDAGVDINAGNTLVERIKPFAKSTVRDGVLTGLGGFGALFEINHKYQQPILVSGTDGVGTKLKLAIEWNMHDGVGIDLVAMSVNDILVQGAEPLFFLDYFACGKLDISVAERVIAGIADGCRQSNCALIGGETAEMPGMYADGDYDLAGFAVGAVEKSQLITGQTIAGGDVILGLASSGLHSNGFSLVRKCIERAKNQLPKQLDGQEFKAAIMQPTKLYVKSVLAAIRQFGPAIKGLVHITGGGLLENVPRILPPNLQAAINTNSWPRSELFSWLQQTAAIDTTEMNRTFNNGIGMVVIVPAEQATQIKQFFSSNNETVYQLGTIEPAATTNSSVVLV